MIGKVNNAAFEHPRCDYQNFYLLSGADILEKQKILIVDYSELVLAMARDALEEAGYEVLLQPTASKPIAAYFQKTSRT